MMRRLGIRGFRGGALAGIVVMVALASGCASASGAQGPGSGGSAASGSSSTSVPSSASGSSSSSASSSPSGSSSPSTTPSPTESVPAGAKTVTTAQNGSTVQIAVGDTVSLVGFPSTWQPKSSDVGVLANPPKPAAVLVCQRPPGGECPLGPMNFVAKAKGTVKLAAHRTQCGEARACVPPNSYDFVLTVVVD